MIFLVCSGQKEFQQLAVEHEVFWDLLVELAKPIPAQVHFEGFFSYD